MKQLNLQFFGFYPLNPSLGQVLQTDAPGVEVDLGFNAHFQIAAANATAGSAVGIHAAIAMAAIVQSIVAGFTQPSVPRNITIKGNAVGNAGNVTIHGTNYENVAISEVIALNGATEVLGVKAFKTITSVDLPVETHAGTDTTSIGFGEVLGLPYKRAHNTVLFAFLNNVKEATAPTVLSNIAAIESNTIDLNSALVGTAVDIYLLA